jgi:chemotaxis protein methyltransferase CheR
MSTVPDDSFDRLTAYIERELNFATSHYNDSYLKRRFASRMRRRDVESYSEYLDMLDGDEEEQAELLDALSINVTGFFRNPDVWDGVRSVLRTLSQSQDRITVWSAGCADGREPYSLSMLAADDLGIDEDSVAITATDINDSALAAAREGVYTSSRTVDMGEQLDYLDDYDAYVDRDGDEFRIRDPVRERIDFRRHDLIRDEPRSGCDLVLCRNLFIYIDGEYKEPVLETVRRSMVPGGHLVIGKAETVPHSLRDEFAVLDSELRIYRRTED